MSIFCNILPLNKLCWIFLNRVCEGKSRSMCLQPKILCSRIQSWHILATNQILCGWNWSWYIWDPSCLESSQILGRICNTKNWNWNPQKRSLMIQQFCSIFASWEWPMFDLKTLPQSQDSNCLKRQGGKNLENKSAIEFCCKLSKCMLLHSLGICKYNDFVWSQICENQWSMAWTDNNMNVQIWLEKSSNGHFL